MSQPSSKAVPKGKAALPSPESLELLPCIRTGLEAGKEMSLKAREEVERIQSELRPWLGEEAEWSEGMEEVDPEVAHAALFSAVQTAVQAADSQMDKLCFKRRPSPPADAKKGVTAALEQLAEEVWRAVAEGTEKPLTHQVARLFPVLEALCATIDALHKTLQDTISRVEAGQPAAQEAKPAPPSLDVSKLEESKSPVSAHPRLLKPPDPGEIRAEIEGIVREMGALAQGKGRSEDSEIGKLRKEVGKIRGKLENVSKSMEEQSCSEPLAGQIPISGLILADDQTEHSQTSLRPASLQTIDTEDIKSELSRHQSTVISVLKEHKQGIHSVAVAQASLQSKQDTLSVEVAEIRRKLNEVFPASYSGSGKKQDLTRGISVLKSLFPDIRSNSDQDFFEKFTRHIMDERRELDTFLTQIRSEGYSFDSLEELASELAKLKAEIGGWQEEREDALLKMIRVQSEYEIEMEFQKAKVSRLEVELSQVRDSVLSSDEVAFLKSKIDELTIENTRLRGDAFDLSSVEQPRESIDDYSKNDELAFLKLQLHQKKERLGKLESRKDSGAATPSEIISMSERYERDAAEIKRLTRQIQTIEGSQDVADSIATRELDMKPVDEKLASHIMTLLNLTGAFEVCGTVSFGEDMWALVKVGRGFVWVKSELDRYKLSSEEMIVQCAQATKMLEAYPNLPRSLVLALGQLMGQTEAK